MFYYGSVMLVMFTDLPDFLTVEEAATVLRLGRSQAYELTRVYRATGGRRGLPVVTLGRRLRVPKTALIRLSSLAEPPGEEAW
jgi:hypothetical protein